MRLITIGCFFFIAAYLSAQDCDMPAALKVMKTPRAEFMHSPEGSLWNDGDDFHAHIIDPTLSSAPARIAFAGGLWYGAIDQNGNLFMRANTYAMNSGESSFSTGPITSDFPNPDICELFNRIWEVSADEINDYLQDWNDNQSIDNPITENIKLWPGQRNKFIEQAFGISLPEMELAPFYDLNANGQYEPDLGDYPDIRGANIAHWWMFNDTGAGAQSQVGVPTADFAVLAYSFDDALSATSTFFYEYKMTNRSQIEFDEMRIALWVDPDIGCHMDDYVGCLPENNLAYAYNISATDGQYAYSCSQGVQTFDLGIPMFGIKVLDGTDRYDSNIGWIDNGMSSFIYNETSQGNFPPPTYGPTNANEYWNNLNTKWRDGTPLTYGGLGFEAYPDINENTNFAFPNDPNDPNGWSMCSTALGPGRRNMIISSGPFNIEQGESQKFAFAAIVTGAIDDYPCPSIDPLVEAADAAQEVYDNLISSTQVPSHGFDMTVFPNPFTEHLNITTGEVELVKIQLFNSQGQIMQQQKNEGKNVIELTIATQLPAGCYWLRVLDKNGNQGFKKIIKI